MFFGNIFFLNSCVCIRFGVPIRRSKKSDRANADRTNHGSGVGRSSLAIRVLSEGSVSCAFHEKDISCFTCMLTDGCMEHMENAFTCTHFSIFFARNLKVIPPGSTLWIQWGNQHAQSKNSEVRNVQHACVCIQMCVHSAGFLCSLPKRRRCYYCFLRFLPFPCTLQGFVPD